jgi:hypothetical protein
MPCEERDRLMDVCFAAIEAGKGIADMTSGDATKEARVACQKAMGALSEHRKVHGC